VALSYRLPLESVKGAGGFGSRAHGVKLGFLTEFP
jgi:hypothetical protein